MEPACRTCLSGRDDNWRASKATATSRHWLLDMLQSIAAHYSLGAGPSALLSLLHRRSEDCAVCTYASTRSIVSFVSLLSLSKVLVSLLLLDFIARQDFISVTDALIIPPKNICLPKKDQFLHITSILLIFSHQLQQAYANVLVTIMESDAYTEQLTYVQGCFWGFDSLGPNLGCGNPIVEECYCRSILGLVASSKLTSCVNKRCTPTVDNVERAVSLYDQYCGTAHSLPATNLATTTTPGSSIPEPSSTVLVIVIITNSPPPSSASTSTFQGGGEFLRNSILIGIVAALYLGPLAG